MVRIVTRFMNLLEGDWSVDMFAFCNDEEPLHHHSKQTYLRYIESGIYCGTYCSVCY